MAYFLQQLANAAPLSALYAALAFGYALAFGMTRRADIAYGAVFAFSGQIYLLFADAGWNRLFLVLPAALAFGAGASTFYSLGAGWLIGARIMRPLHTARPVSVIVAGMAVLVVLSETARLASGSRGLWLPPFLNEPVEFLREDGFAVTLTRIQILNALLLVALVLGGHAILTRSRLGRVWRAVSDDPRAAELCGVSAGRVFEGAYLAAAGFATVSGLLATSYYGTMDFGAGLIFGLKVVLIAAAGGHARPARAAAGAALLGLCETLWSGYGPLLWRDLVVISGLVLLLVLSRRERQTAV